jgi:hypothetical protein
VKVRISTVVDIPEAALLKGAEYRFPSAIQILFDDITNYVTCSHLVAAAKWCCKAKAGSPKEDKSSTEYRIYRHHSVWGKKCGALNWEYEEVKT